MIKTEKQLLSFIKYSPIALILSFSILINIVIFTQNEANFKKELQNYKTNFIHTHKQIIKAQVDKTHNDILREKKDSEQVLKGNLKEHLNKAYSIIDNLYKKNKHLGEKRVIELIKNALREVRFNSGRGYYYIFDIKGTVLLHPINSHLEGASKINSKDSRGRYIIQKLLKNHKIEKEIYSNHYWVKPNDLKKVYKKINLTKIYEPLNIILGTGEYLDDFTNELKTHILEEHIQKSTYGKNGYIFVVDFKGNYLAHVKEEYIGLNRMNLADKEGFMITKELIKTAKNGGGYISYIGTIMPETGQPAKKTTYVKKLADWDWLIASGFYEKEMFTYLNQKEKELIQLQEEYLTKTILISFALTLVLMIIVSILSKYLQQAFKEYNDRIIAEVNENRRKDHLLHQQSKMASMGEMIGNIAHQWRQPLNLISTATSRIQIEKEFGTLDEAKHDESLEAILKSTKYLSQTIDDFREFFNPNKIVSYITTVSLFEKTKQLISSRYKNKGITIIEDIEDVELCTYENELVQSLINVLNNAVDALIEKDQKKKYIFFEAKYSNSCDETNCTIMDCKQRTMDGGFTLIKIRDNAGGINEKSIDKIFEAYFTTKHQSRGTGIGLYMTYEIITKHLEGFINVHNVEYDYDGKKHIGAEFKICLPANTHKKN